MTNRRQPRSPAPVRPDGRTFHVDFEAFTDGLMRGLSLFAFWRE